MKKIALNLTNFVLIYKKSIFIFYSMSHILLHEYSEDDEPNPSELSGDENT